MPPQQPSYKLGSVVIALDAVGAPVHINVQVTTPFGNMAQGSLHGLDFSVSQDDLQALATARGVTVDLFDELLTSIAEHIQAKHGQAVDIPSKRQPGPPQ